MSDVTDNPASFKTHEDHSILWNKRYENLSKVTEFVTHVIDFESISKNMADYLLEVTDCDLAYVYLLSTTDNGEIEYTVKGDPNFRSSDSFGRLTLDVGRTRQLVLNNKPIITDRTNPHADDVVLPDSTTGNYSTAISVPLFADGETVGIYSILFRQTKACTQQDMEYLLIIGRLLGSVIRQLQMAQRTIGLQMLLESKRLRDEVNDEVSKLVELLKFKSKNAPLSYLEDTPEAIRFNREEYSHAEPLTQRETDILRLLSKGKSNEEIASVLFVSEGTIKKQLSYLMQRLNLDNRVQAAVFAVHIGLFDES